MNESTSDRSTAMTEHIHAALRRRFPNEDPEHLLENHADIVEYVRRHLTEYRSTVSEYERSIEVHMNAGIASRENPFHEGLLRALSIP